MLSIDAASFLRLCRKHPIPHEYLVERALERKDMFNNYKSILLISYMKTIKR